MLSIRSGHTKLILIIRRIPVDSILNSVTSPSRWRMSTALLMVIRQNTFFRAKDMGEFRRNGHQQVQERPDLQPTAKPQGGYGLWSD